MPIILDNYPVPEQGQVDINVQFSFELNIGPLEARKAVNSWLLNEVSYLIGAGKPTLVLSEKPNWRVPVWLTFAGASQKNIVGIVDVDVQTGQIINANEVKAKLETYLNQTKKSDLTMEEFMIQELPSDYLVDLDPVPLDSQPLN